MSSQAEKFPPRIKRRDMYIRRFIRLIPFKIIRNSGHYAADDTKTDGLVEAGVFVVVLEIDGEWIAAVVGVVNAENPTAFPFFRFSLCICGG
jgi:hypothetical protein